MTIVEKSVLSSDKIHNLKGKLYLPDGNIKGIFHVVHGMTEHIGRYDAFMRKMASLGYLTFGYDHLGHGLTAVDKSELGFIAHKDGYKYLIDDVGIFADVIRKEYGLELPYYLLGHSMGSFIVRLAVSKGLCPDKLIVMGTGGANPLANIGLFLISTIKAIKGEKHVSKFIYSLAFGSYNKTFDGDSNYEWLSKIEKVKTDFEQDEFCQYKFTASAMHDLITLNKLSNKADCFKTTCDVPILLISGQDDPVGNYGKGVEEVYNNLLKHGKNATIKLYANCRHEILNETCKDEVYQDIVEFLTK